MSTVSEECLTFEVLKAYASGQLGVPEARNVEKHLEGCEHCCIQLSQVVDTAESQPAEPGTDLANVSDSQLIGTSGVSANPAYRFWAQQSASKVTNPLPAMIGRYRVERLIGSGGFGRVYLAFDEQLGRQVAIKVPHARTHAIEKQLTLIQKEAKIVASLDHPNIVPIYDVGSTSDFPVYLVSKLINGKNLASELQAGVSASQAVMWTLQIAEALAYAHEQGVIHRDVKPQNIIVDSQGQARLTDFGLAWKATEDLSDYPNAGTPAYMSPEQRRAGEHVDQRSDIYALGKVLAELLGADTLAAREGTEGLVGICRKATAPNPEDRFQTADELAKCLLHYAEKQGWSAVIVSQSVNSSNTLTAHWPSGLRAGWRSWIVLAMLAGLLLWGATAWRTWQRQQDELSNIHDYLKSFPSELGAHLERLGSLSEAGVKHLHDALDSADTDVRVRAQVALMDHQPEFVFEVADQMLISPVELSGELAKTLVPHREKLKERMLTAIQDDSKRGVHRLNAAGFLAMAFPTDQLWQNGELTSLLKALLLQDDMVDLLTHTRHLGPIRSGIVNQLRSTVLSAPDRSDPKLNRVFELWSRLVVDDVNERIDFIIECPVDLVAQHIAKLKGDQRAIDRLHAVLDFSAAKLEAGYRKPLNRAKFLAAVTLHQLGETKPFWSIWEDGQDPDLRTVATFTIAESQSALAIIADRLISEGCLDIRTKAPVDVTQRGNRELAARRQLVHALFRTPKWQTVGAARAEELLKTIRSLVIDADSGMHAQAYWILKGLTPANEWERESWFPRDKVTTDDGQRNWSLNSLGMVMIRLENAETVGHAFSLCQREVERKHFDEFLRDTKYAFKQIASKHSDAEHRDHQPQNYVSWYDCAAFCNWLSRREGLEECYQPNADGQFAEGMSLKPDAIGMGGYRLPLSAEWQVCCTAGAKTRFAFGDDESLVRVWMGGGHTTEVTPTGHLPPNAFGFFDMHGNVAEWMLDLPEVVDSGNAQPVNRITRGGDFRSSQTAAAVDRFASHPPELRSETIGFRIARTHVQ